MSNIRIFVGTAANNEDLESQMVLEYTLRKHTKATLEIEWMKQSRDPASFWSGWNTLGWATPFSGFRWGVPARCNFEGKAIYLDSDMIAMGDIAELWETPMVPSAAVIAKGHERFCCTLFDCAKVKPAMIPLDRLKSLTGMHREQRQKLDKSGLVQKFSPNANWNCLDGEAYENLHDPRIKMIHYTEIDTQPHLRRATNRLAKDGREHWFNGHFRTHRRPDLMALFEEMYNEALANGYTLDQYVGPTFGKYPVGGSTGGQFATDPKAAHAKVASGR